MTEEIKKDEMIKIPAILSVGEFAELLKVPVSQVIAELMKNGVMATINENIDFETAEIIAEFMGFKVEKEEEAATEKGKEVTLSGKDFVPRFPVVAVLGHVDHGKTSLLDKIRESNVVAGESGGITQHIGAYRVEVRDSSTKLGTRKVTFLDTPGHEAFEKMRAHGARITDIAIIIVAADDGIKPQTTEAIRHAQEANTPMVVAVNKIDKPGADPMRVRTQFNEIGLLPQEWGGELEFVDVSAKSGEGIDKLLETLLTMAELMDLKADPKIPGQGVVIESKIEVGKGPVASVLVQNGTVRQGDWIQVGETYGRIKGMEDELGKKIKEAGPSVPVKISGLKSVPDVAEIVNVFGSEKEVKEEAAKTQKYAHVKKFGQVKKLGLEELTASFAQSEKKELNLVVKADVLGSLEAVKESLSKLNNKEVGIKFVGEGVGEISESDIVKADVSDKIILGFKAPVAAGVNSLAKAKGVKILKYDVIYELIDDMKSILADMMPIERIEISVGILKVLAVFKQSNQRTVFGGRVEDGKAEKDVMARIKRNGEKVGTYKVAAVQREKEEVNSVPAGSECGISIEGKADVAEGDVVEFFRVEERRKTLG